MVFDLASNSSHGATPTAATFASLAAGLLWRSASQTSMETASRPFSDARGPKQELSDEMTALLGLKSSAAIKDDAIFGAGQPDQKPRISQNDIKPEARRTSRTKRASPYLQNRLDTALRYALAGFDQQFGRHNPNLPAAPDSFSQLAFDKGLEYGGTIRGTLNSAEYTLMHSNENSQLRQVLEDWVTVYAYAHATAGDLYRWDYYKIIGWARREVAQIDAQADDDVGEKRRLEAYHAGKNSEIAISRTRGIIGALWAYPNEADMNRFAPCGKPVYVFDWIDKNALKYQFIVRLPDPDKCLGDASTDEAYMVSRRLWRGSQNEIFRKEDAVHMPRGVILRVSSNEVAQNCGPDNILIRKVSMFNPFYKIPLCPPYVPPYKHWRDSMKSSLVTEYERKHKRGLSEQDVFSANQRQPTVQPQQRVDRLPRPSA
ncbi:hypothetical protein GT347_02335 [Xylophilus rhododendri]|uniref:Uncharacterized protein n=1 Tax=Xylophilus rhododendri TaxID=2697032 RepID=A0A857IZN1_9BURK|nr:hypothetical protein [Xylophilus rhododendri]QHI96926.1 hypothetical protein GT347_02335 [Xylophilus rhododendri]